MYYDYDSFLLPLYLSENFPNIINQPKTKYKRSNINCIKYYRFNNLL